MENLGYKEGSAKVRRAVARTISSASRPEAEPFLHRPPQNNNNSHFQHNARRYRPQLPHLRVQWNKNTDTMIETQYPSPEDEYEYMECGPSPPAETAPSMYDTFEEHHTELSLQICSDTLRCSLLEQMQEADGRLQLMDDIEQGNIIAENIRAHFEGATEMEKNLSYLWAAFLKRWDLLPGFLELGVDLEFCEQQGMGALHLGAFSGCLTTLSFLIEKGADINLQPVFYTPLQCAAFGNAAMAAKLLLSHGAKLDLDTRKPFAVENLLQCAVRSNAMECLQLFIEAGADVNDLRPNGTNAIHLAADLGYSQCLAALLRAEGADPNVRICVSEKESTALHLAADEGNVDCVQLLLSKGADAKLKNHRGFTALHLAARTSSLPCVEALLRHGNADPNAKDFDHRTPLHAAVGRADSACDILELLLKWGANVNQKDAQGYTALHLAALDGLTQCVELLIYYNADVTTKSKKGTTALNVITRKTPAAVAMMRQKLDAAITVLHHSEDAINRELELQLDFRQLLQYCSPREISYLNTFVDEGQKELLEHPLCSAYLYIKWGKIRKYYIGRLIFCFIFVLGLSMYVMTALAHNCYNSSKQDDFTFEQVQARELCQKQSMLGDMLRNNPFVMETQWWSLVAITIVEIGRKLFGMSQYSSIRHYVLTVENIIEWFIITSVFIISYIYTKQTYTFQNHIGAFAVLLGWAHLMLMIGQLPVFDVYVAMFMRVLSEFAKIFIAYSCMLIGFTISFCVIFPADPKFSNPLMGFVTVLVMMVGEIEADLVVNDPNGKDPPFLLEVSAQITFVLFLLFVTIILQNLLVGIAVHDIRGLKQTAGILKLVRQTKLIAYMEAVLFMGYLPKWLRGPLHRSALVSPDRNRVVLSVKPLNPSEKRLPREILMAAYEIVKTRQSAGPMQNTAKAMDSASLISGHPPYSSSNEGINPVNLSTLTARLNDSSAGIDYLTHEIAALKQALIAQQQQASKVIEKLSTIITNQHKQSSNSLS